MSQTAAEVWNQEARGRDCDSVVEEAPGLKGSWREAKGTCSLRHSDDVSALQS